MNVPIQNKVAVTADGATQVHAIGDGVYATLCGLDGEENQVEPAQSWEKITCPQCYNLWRAWRAYQANDFVLRLRIAP